MLLFLQEEWIIHMSSQDLQEQEECIDKKNLHHHTKLHQNDKGKCKFLAILGSR
jgi:hypothetical protein